MLSLPDDFGRVGDSEPVRPADEGRSVGGQSEVDLPDFCTDDAACR